MVDICAVEVTARADAVETVALGEPVGEIAAAAAGGGSGGAIASAEFHNVGAFVVAG